MFCSAYNQGLRTEPPLAEIRAHVRAIFSTVMAWKKQYSYPTGAPHVNAAAAYTYWYKTPAKRWLLAVYCCGRSRPRFPCCIWGGCATRCCDVIYQAWVLILIIP